MRHPPHPLAFLATLALGVGSASGQAVTMESPDGVFSESFSVIQTVRELPDGRVLVADPLGQALVAVDFGRQAGDTLGRVGQGPAEYRQPDAVWPLPGGETLLVDLGNGRLTRLGADLSFGDTRPYTVGEMGPGRELILAIPQGVDDQGRLYFRSMGSPGRGGMMADSAWVLRLEPATDEVDSIAPFKITGRTRQTSGGANNQNVSIQQIPLSPADAWGVAPDGRVVLARVGDYRVEWVGPDGSVTRGPSYEWDAVRIGQAEKEEWASDRDSGGGGLAIGVTMQNGSMSMQATRGGGGGNSDLDQYQWPDIKPPFYADRIAVDAQGRAWVRRHVDAGDPPSTTSSVATAPGWPRCNSQWDGGWSGSARTRSTWSRPTNSVSRPSSAIPRPPSEFRVDLPGREARGVMQSTRRLSPGADAASCVLVPHRRRFVATAPHHVSAFPRKNPIPVRFFAVVRNVHSLGPFP